METECVALTVISAIMGAIAVFFFLISYRQHKEKGVIFTNNWILASKKERAEVDERIKKAEYIVGRNVFFSLGILFLLYAINFQLWISWLFHIGYVIIAIIVVYAIAQHVTNERLYKSIKEEKAHRQKNII